MYLYVFVLMYYIFVLMYLYLYHQYLVINNLEVSEGPAFALDCYEPYIQAEFSAKSVFYYTQTSPIVFICINNQLKTVLF